MYGKILAFFCLLGCLPASSGVFLPKDMDTQDVWIVSGDKSMMPEDFGKGMIWDLSDAVIDRHFTRLYRRYGDTLITRTAESRREFFSVAGDTVWAFGAGSRFGRSGSAGTGIPYLLPLKTGSEVKLRDSVYVNLPFCSVDRYGLYGVMDAEPSGGFIFAGCDTVPSTLLVRTLTADSGGSRRFLRWYADGFGYPVVEYTEYADSAGNAVGAVTLVCPPSEQKRPAYAKSRTCEPAAYPVRGDGDGITDSAPMGLPPYRVSFGDGCVTVSFSDGYSPSSACMISDSLGRVYADATGDCTLRTSGLPPGTYILHIDAGSESYSHTFTIN